MRSREAEAEIQAQAQSLEETALETTVPRHHRTKAGRTGAVYQLPSPPLEFSFLPALHVPN